MTLDASDRTKSKLKETGLSAPRSANLRWGPCGEVFEFIDRIEASPVSCSAVDGRSVQRSGFGLLWSALAIGAAG